MPTFRHAAITAVLVAALAPTLATAKPLRRHKAHMAHRVHGPVYANPYADRFPPGYGPTSADPYAPYYVEDPYSPYAAPGAAIRALALRNQYAPGVTNELAPGNIATATGGPAGGVPGFGGR